MTDGEIAVIEGLGVEVLNPNLRGHFVVRARTPVGWVYERFPLPNDDMQGTLRAWLAKFAEQTPPEA